MNQLSLAPFSINNADIVINWRNSERIRCNMLDDSVIQQSSHFAFLDSLKTDESKAYFLIELNNFPVGTIYFTGLGSNQVVWGCYIGTDMAIPGLFVAQLIVAIQYAFNFDSTETLYSEVASHNTNPIKLNKFLGIKQVSEEIKVTTSGREITFLEYRLERVDVERVLKNSNKVLPSSMKEALENINWSIDGTT